MTRKLQLLTALLAFGVLLIGLSGCGENTTEPDSDNEITEPPQLNVTDRVPDGLQSNSPQAWAAVTSMLSQVEIGQSMYSSIYTTAAQAGGEFSMTVQGITATYLAEPETRNGVEGTAWSLTYDGQFTDADTSITFNDATVFSGWTANNGDQGQFTYDYDVYADVQGDGSGDQYLYEVNWSVDDQETITVHSSIMDEGEETEQTLIVNEDGSGEYSHAGETMYQWNSEGELINN